MHKTSSEDMLLEINIKFTVIWSKRCYYLQQVYDKIRMNTSFKAFYILHYKIIPLDGLTMLTGLHSSSKDVYLDAESVL